MGSDDDRSSGRDRPGKSQRKRDMQDLQTLGLALTELTEHQLDAFELPAKLRDAIDAARRMHKRGALYRQRQYIGRLMREVDATAIRATFQRVTAHDRARAARHAAVERWRERMLQQPDRSIEQFLANCPGAEPRRLRRLVREALHERSRGSPTGAARTLFRYLREQLDGDGPGNE